MNQKGFIPIIFIIIGAVVFASATFGVVKYRDEITANVLNAFKGSKVETPNIDSTEQGEIQNETQEEAELVEEPTQPEASSVEEKPKQDNDQELQEKLRIAEQKRLEAERKLAEEKRKQEEQERLEAERKEQEAERQRQEELKKRSEVYRDTLISLFTSLAETFKDFKESCLEFVSLTNSRKDKLAMLVKENQKTIRIVDDSYWESLLEELNEFYRKDIEVSELYIRANQQFIDWLDAGINKFEAYTSFLSRSDEIISKDEFDKRTEHYKKWSKTFNEDSEKILRAAEQQRNFVNQQEKFYSEVLALMEESLQTMKRNTSSSDTPSSYDYYNNFIQDTQNFVRDTQTQIFRDSLIRGLEGIRSELQEFNFQQQIRHP